MLRTYKPSCAVVALGMLGGLFPANAADFTFTSESGAIIKLQRAPDLVLNGSVCAPSMDGGCESIAVTGTNSPGKLSLDFGGINGKLVDYVRLKQGKPESLQGYTVWTTASPDAPEYLRSFRAPVVKSDPLSDQYLQAWNGDSSKLIDLKTFEKAQKAFESFVDNRGYPDHGSSIASIVTSRQDAASWEALSIRELGLVPAISTFNSDQDGAVVSLDKKVISSSLSNQEELSPYVALGAGLDPPRAGVNVIDRNVFSIDAPVESIFDEYANPGTRSAATSKINSLLAKYLAMDGCKIDLPNDQYIPIDCITHTTNYIKRRGADKIFVSCLFLAFINEPVSGIRNVRVTQEAWGGTGPADRAPPPSDQFNLTPMSNANVMYVQRQLRTRIGQAFVAAFPTLNVRQ